VNVIEETIRPNGIILSHDTKEQTVEMLPDLMGFLKKHHYTVIPVSAVVK
jgi:peptidoglycan/xylan/chitin deacetylase (PgdA/CDA1 family)